MQMFVEMQVNGKDNVGVNSTYIVPSLNSLGLLRSKIFSQLVLTIIQHDCRCLLIHLKVVEVIEDDQSTL